jgi:serine/threonine protein kinase/formylglycine-generating enzyme required for sulfatase activity
MTASIGANGTATSFKPPPSFDEYRLVELLGRGGMGEVYLAYDKILDRPVAVKFISGLEPSQTARERFLVEARAAARLQHPNVVTIYRVGELDDRPFIISEFVHGKSLDTLAKPMDFTRALELGRGLARGLAAAHRRNVLHRDIKPANAILTDDGEVKLLDFGLAKLLDPVLHGSEPAGAAAFAARSPAPLLPPASSSLLAPSALLALLPPRASFSSPLLLTTLAQVTPRPPVAAAPQPSTTTPRSASTTPRSLAGPAQSTADLAAALEARPPPTPVVVHAAPRESTLASAPGPAALPRADGAGDDAPAIDPDAASAITDAGTLLGTPDYLPPELWRGEAATRRSDVYSLGALLFELCTGHPPHRDVPITTLPHLIQRSDAARLIDLVPGIDPRFSAVIERCLRRNPADRFASGDELREALEQVGIDARGPALPDGNPYRGLHSFEAEHRALFFGRRAEIGAVIDRLRSEPLVLVAGDSGVGKSSLCRAGVLPHVEEGAIDDTRAWSVVALVPGRRPLAALAAALAPHLDIDEEVLLKNLYLEPAALARSLRRHHGETRGLVLFVDQLEELVTMGDEIETEILGEALRPLTAGVPGVRLLMTVRSDFLTRVVAVTSFGDEVSRRLYLLRPLSVEGTRDAIVGPARAKGVTFESDTLVSTLVADAEITEGGLPLLQFALAELWDARDVVRASITSAALAAIGGVGGALARHADAVLLGLGPAPRAAARRILIALVTLDGTRARRPEDELAGGDPVAHGALAALVRARLLVARDTELGPTYELAHEALVKGWATLARWIEQQADTRPARHRLETAAAEWDRLGRVREAQWRAHQLTEIGQIAQEDLAPRDAAFLEASRDGVRRARFVRRALFAAVPVVTLLIYGGVRLHARRDLDHQVRALVADADVLLGGARHDAASAEARRKDAFASFDAFDRERGETIWAEALSLADKADRGYGGAAQALETTLIVDAARTDVQGLLGDVLYERATLADQAHRATQRDELLQRLGLYDHSGERRHRWDAPAHLAVESVPPGARISVFRFTPSATSGFHGAPSGLAPGAPDLPGQTLLKLRDLGPAPIPDLTLEPGSYLLTLALPDHAPVRYPILLARGEALRLSIPVPLLTRVPEGFVYVPHGRFLFGSAADEEVRRAFFNTAPLHPVETGAYLIARNETTYAEWLTYLGALPPKERARRTPKVSGLTGALELTQLEGGEWQLTLQPTTRVYTAKSGEMIHYESRKRRFIQDWLRFPVSGISLEDAEGYAGWLDATGRVPGARLCDEHEWERAARGADGREFPHGDRLEPDDANIDATYGKQPLAFGPDEVGSHPASRSPFGLDDACGNVFEWTTSRLAARENVLRGGAYYYDITVVRSSNRQVSEPTARDPNIGIRICATPSSG